MTACRAAGSRDVVIELMNTAAVRGSPVRHVQPLTGSPRLEHRSGFACEGNRIVRADGRYAGVNVTVWVWLVLLVDSLLTAVRFRSDTRSACEISTVCGCVAIP